MLRNALPVRRSERGDGFLFITPSPQLSNQRTRGTCSRLPGSRPTKPVVEFVHVAGLPKAVFRENSEEHPQFPFTSCQLHHAASSVDWNPKPLLQILTPQVKSGQTRPWGLTFLFCVFLNQVIGLTNKVASQSYTRPVHKLPVSQRYGRLVRRTPFSMNSTPLRSSTLVMRSMVLALPGAISQPAPSRRTSVLTCTLANSLACAVPAAAGHGRQRFGLTFGANSHPRKYKAA